MHFSQVRHLEETGAALAEDLIQKSAIIQAYAMETKIGEVFQINQQLPYTAICVGLSITSENFLVPVVDDFRHPS